MSLSEERKQVLISSLRGKSVVKENLPEDYKKYLSLVTREELTIPVSTGRTVTCYVFQSPNKQADCPLLINIHGGGFVRPHELRDEYFSARMACAIDGVTVDVDYRLAPEFPYPTALDETYDVVKWVLANSEKWGFDAGKAAVEGSSAGANLAAAICLKAKKTGDFKLRQQILCYPPLDMLTDPADKPNAASNKIPAERGRMFNEAYTDGDIEKAKDIYCSPVFASEEDLQGLPEALIIVGGKDNFRYEDTDYARKLALAGVTVTAKVYLESNHGFVTYCSGDWQEAQDLMIRTLRSMKALEK